MLVTNFTLNTNTKHYNNVSDTLKIYQSRSTICFMMYKCNVGADLRRHC